MRRRAAAGAIVVAAFLSGTGSADGAPGTSTDSAIGFWELTDATNTRVSVQATERKGADDLFLFVTQDFCDTTANEQVFRSFGFNGAVREAAVVIPGNLKKAQLRAAVPLTGSETRLDGCDGNGEVVSDTPIGPLAGRIDVSWTATGPLVVVQPQISSRDATATGRLDPIGPLGTASFASLQRFTP